MDSNWQAAKGILSSDKFLRGQSGSSWAGHKGTRREGREEMENERGSRRDLMKAGTLAVEMEKRELMLERRRE